jgi:hypothetical protein
MCAAAETFRNVSADRVDRIVRLLLRFEVASKLRARREREDFPSEFIGKLPYPELCVVSCAGHAENAVHARCRARIACKSFRRPPESCRNCQAPFGSPFGNCVRSVAAIAPTPSDEIAPTAVGEDRTDRGTQVRTDQRRNDRTDRRRRESHRPPSEKIAPTTISIAPMSVSRIAPTTELKFAPIGGGTIAPTNVSTIAPTRLSSGV